MKIDCSMTEKEIIHNKHRFFYETLDADIWIVSLRDKYQILTFFERNLWVFRQKATSSFL
jgi:hypothetical protein